jgi:hypothetical protein
MLKHLYKRAAKAYELNDNSTFILTLNVYTLTATKVKAV